MQHFVISFFFFFTWKVLWIQARNFSRSLVKPVFFLHCSFVAIVFRKRINLSGGQLDNINWIFRSGIFTVALPSLTNFLKIWISLNMYLLSHLPKSKRKIISLYSSRPKLSWIFLYCTCLFIQPRCESSWMDTQPVSVWHSKDIALITHKMNHYT